jgi:hypothetical protein
MGQGRGYIRMIRESFDRTHYGTYAANWMYGTYILVLNVWTWSRGDISGLELIDGDVSLLNGMDCNILN